MKLRAMFAIAAILIAGCGSDGGVNGDTSTNDGGPTTDTPTGPSGDGASTPTNDSGVGPGTDQDSGSTTDQDGGSTTDQDSGSTGDQDSGSGGGDQDGGVTTDSGSGGGDQDGGTGGGADSGSGGGDQDGGVTTGDSGSGSDQDSGSGGGQDGGTNGGGSDSGSGGGDDGGDSCHPHSCVYTQGYYKNHTSSVTGLTLGGVSYSQSEVLGFLNATPNGDDSLILAKQLIAALLNNGQCDPNASATVQAAQDWMAANKDQDGTLPYGTCCVNQSDPGCTAYSLGQTLDSYNSGYAGTPHCQ